MTVSTYALITLAEAKVFPGLSAVPASDDAILEGLIDAAAADFEDYWDNYGVRRSVTEKVTWHDIKLRSRDLSAVYLSRYPISSVESITDPASNTIAATEYWIDSERGILRTTGTWKLPQDSNGFVTYWTIVYTAGRVAATANIPANIKAACKAWVADLYKRPDRDVISKSVGDLSLGYRSSEVTGGLPEYIQHKIAVWKKREV
jgi:hypothetical protein